MTVSSTSNKQQATSNKHTVFDDIDNQDLIVAFYPCIYFCALSQVGFTLGYINYQKLNDVEKIQQILVRDNHRKEFYDRLCKFVAVCLDKGIRMIFEDPWSQQTYLKANFLKAPDIVDMDRTKRGDIYQKPTAYWFWNCKPMHGYTEQISLEHKSIIHSRKASKAGLCSEERSMITHDYARNWICDFVLGKTQNVGQLQFDFF